MSQLMKIVRIPKHMYYLDVACTISKRSTCLRAQYGAVLVKDDRIVGTGYNGAPKGRKNCTDIGGCYRINHKIPSGTQYETCKSVHAEMNAIINSCPEDRKGAILYLSGSKLDKESYKDTKNRQFTECCDICKRLIINSGISQVIVPDFEKNWYQVYEVNDWIKNEDILFEDHESSTSDSKDLSEGKEWLRAVLEGYLSLIIQNSETPSRNILGNPDDLIFFSIDRLQEKINKVLSEYTPEEARLYKILLRSFESND